MKCMSWLFLIIPALLAGQKATASDRLLAGQTLSNDQYIQSPNGKYILKMQVDGSLDLYRLVDGSVVYRMSKYGSYAIMQFDGNFVEYNSNGVAIWNSGTYQCGSECYLQLRDNGGLTIGFGNSSVTYVAWGTEPDLDYPAYDAARYPMTSGVQAGQAPTSIPNPSMPTLTL